MDGVFSTLSVGNASARGASARGASARVILAGPFRRLTRCRGDQTPMGRAKVGMRMGIG